jgi:hypothetical protein
MSMVVKLSEEEVQIIRSHRYNSGNLDCRVCPATMADLFNVNTDHDLGHPNWTHEEWNDCRTLSSLCTVCDAEARFSTKRGYQVCTYHYNGCPKV